MPNQPGARKLYLALGAPTVLVGLLVRFHGDWMGGAARDVTGDALWAMMMACWVSAIAPRQRSIARCAAALTICFAVETSQLWHAPVLEYARSNRLGQLVFGSGFDPRDFAAYALGVLVFVLLDRRLTAPVADTLHL